MQSLTQRLQDDRKRDALLLPHVVRQRLSRSVGWHCEYSPCGLGTWVAIIFGLRAAWSATGVSDSGCRTSLLSAGSWHLRSRSGGTK